MTYTHINTVKMIYFTFNYSNTDNQLSHLGHKKTKLHVELVSLEKKHS